MMMKPLVYTFGVAALCAAISTTGPVLFNAPAKADEISDRDDVARRLNLAGRQRMLTQHMTKSVCFAVADVNKDKHKGSLSQAIYLFQSTLTSLRDGSAAQGLKPEDHKEVLDGLTRVSRLWVPFAGAINTWSLGFDTSTAPLEQIYELNVPLLKEMNKTVGIMEATYNEQKAAVSPATSRAINIAGRQRMLSQRMAKDFCLVASKFKTDEKRERLKATVEEFTGAIDALTDGSSERGLDPAPSEIADQLERVKRIYGRMERPIRKAIEGKELRKKDMDLVSRTSLLVLTEMDKVVYLFEELD
ncbi:MAG: type IV pili methyl-accepting chemotaxis transducer N-terminal domain-containing protein [Pseudomonadota bacterium]